MKKTLFFLIIGFFLFTNNNILAFDVKTIPKTHTYIIDQADILSVDEENKLSDQMKIIEDTTTSEILVVTLSDLGGDDISKLGVEIGTHLGVGKKDVDNGLVILIAPNDREWNISTGYGVEGILPDIRTKAIGEKNFPQYFKKNQYFQGISSALIDINGFLISDKTILSKYTSNQNTKTANNFEDIIGFLIFGSLFISSCVYRKKEKKFLRFLKFIIISIITSGLVYIFLSHLFIIFNILLQGLLALLIDKIGNTNFGSGFGSGGPKGGSSHRSRTFGGGSFGGGGSKGKW